MTATAPAAAATASDTLTTAVVFPGQGSQRPGMAAPWRDLPAYRLWTEADELLGRDVTRLGLDASAEELREPVNCQVALFVHGAVLLEAWRNAGGTAAVAAGHSLGEYNALLAAGILTFADGLRLVERRAVATQAAAKTRPGGMVASLGGDPAAVRDACSAAGAWMANDNAEGQLVVAGDEDALERFTAAAGEVRARVIRLEVGAGYHSPLMEPAVPTFSDAVTSTGFRDGDLPVVSNVDASPHTRGADWPDLLRAQLTTPVRWRETMLCLQAMGGTDLVELGASPVLTGLAKRTVPALRRRCITAPDEMAAA